MKVIIIGGGIGGLTCARACLDGGMEVELYEKRPLEGMLSGPGGIFIQNNAMRVYERLAKGKLSQELWRQGGIIKKGGFFNQKGVPLYINRPQFVDSDNLGVCLLRPQLARILYHSLPPEIVNPQTPLIDFEETSTGVKAIFSSSHTTTGDVLIGADGLYSQVRAKLKGGMEPPIYSGMTCWRGVFTPTDGLLPTEYSWGELWGRGARFGYFEVGGGQYSFYAFKNAPMRERDTQDAKSTLRSIFSDFAPVVLSIIELLEEDKIYRDDIFDREPLGVQWGQGRVTLMGDAAHPVQPNLGQGGCQAVEDAYELVKHLQGQQGDIPSRLRQFEGSRTPRVERVFKVSRQIGKLGQTEHPLGCLARDWLYRLTPTWLGDLQFKWLFDYYP